MPVEEFLDWLVAADFALPDHTLLPLLSRGASSA
jgi:hypothetical protein